MTNKEKLDLINSMKFVEVDSEYVLVEYNEENLNKLAKIVPNLNKYLSEYGDPHYEKEVIDITLAAFNHAGATFWGSEKFVSATKEELLDMYFERVDEIEKLKSSILSIGKVIEESGNRVADELLRIQELVK